MNKRVLTHAYAIGDTSLGKVLVAHDAEGICAVMLGDDEHAVLTALKARWGEQYDRSDAAISKQYLNTVIRQIETPTHTLSVPLSLQGTAFQQLVWKTLQSIPLGQTSTYSAVAAKMGRPKAFRAVANACAKNPVAILVPCHRVVHKQGSLSGYYWGTQRKQALLAREHQAAQKAGAINVNPQSSVTDARPR